MRTEAEIRQKGIEALLKELGDIDTEIFIKMLIREPFDYTQWQKDHRQGRAEPKKHRVYYRMKEELLKYNITSQVPGELKKEADDFVEFLKTRVGVV